MDFAGLLDLKNTLKECLDLSCEYKIFVSLGEPPADCNSIGIWHSDSTRSRNANSECNTRFIDSDIRITITRCCVTADASLIFDPAQEEKDAECFHNDLAILLQCLTCNDLLEDYIISCGANISSVRYDRSKSGGCYSAEVVLSLTEEICCP